MLDILIPTCNRRAALAVTLTALLSQNYADFRIIVADQTDDDARLSRQIEAVSAVHRGAGRDVTITTNRPRRGLAQQRRFLFEHSTAPEVLFLDHDLILEAWVSGCMLHALGMRGAGS